MNNSILLICFSFVVLVLSSCRLTDSNTSSGRPYEVLVVMDQAEWERAAGKVLKEVLCTDVQGLPQSEPSFQVMYASPKHFDSSLKLVRNIILVDINNSYAKSSFEYAKDSYASPQMILTIQSPDAAEFQQFVKNNQQTIINFFTRAEMNRDIALLQKKHNSYITQVVDSLFGCNIQIPASLNRSKVGEHFVWASTDTGFGDQNFVMYSYPYTDKNTLTKFCFVQKRDSVMHANIPGFKEGTYMATDSLLTDVKLIDSHQGSFMEARGLWRMKNDFMGGPYISHVRIDSVNHNVITTEIFVYSPDKMKRNLMRQMEAALYTLKMPIKSGEQ